MGGVAKVFKSVASFATQLASPAGILGMAQKAFDFASKLSKSLAPLSPKTFGAFDKKIASFLGPANKVLKGANAFLKQAGTKAAHPPVAPAPKPIASLQVHVAPPAGIAFV